MSITLCFNYFIQLPFDITERKIPLLNIHDDVKVLRGKSQNGTDPVEGRTAAKNITASEVGT